ncbi:DNA polymerase III subunit delta [Salinimonas marina]|uniref:DNA polymerase III subunit delta n=1 Tax=Salinimonas marina TaxID=2785918 RepID=A0A7S9HCF8_9ALTE|nr:DNA polymerase III subunit delta [Salinimonas marina]QPG04396.1 DNA polymerase III subunit delta [Salinimonas marina]
MQVYPNRFHEQLSQGLQSCYLLFGDEPQQKFSMMNAVREQARKQGFEERTVLVADKDFSWSQLLEATQAMSLFSSMILIELELPTGKPGTEGSKMLQSVAEGLSSDILLLVHGPKIGKDVQKAKWFKALDAIGVHSICYALEGRQLHSWIQQTLQQFNVKADAVTVALIADFCEGNMLAAHQEIEKLALVYAGQTVTREQVEQIIVDQSRFTVFQLIDVMLSGEQQRCVKMLYRLESEGIEPNIVIWALIREFQLLWKLKTLQEQNQPVSWQRFGIWRNRQGCYENALARLSKPVLAQIREQLKDADVAFKQNQVVRPYVKLCHLCMLFMGVPLTLPLGASVA